jgi:hypothetical protein
MNTARHNGMTVSGPFLGTACLAAILPRSLFSKALKDKAGISSVAVTAILPNKQSGSTRRG